MALTSWLPFESFVEESGGRLLYTGGDLERLFARLGEEFRSQYYLAYDTDPKGRRGRRRALRVELARPGAVVRAMSGWSAPSGRIGTLLREARHEDAGVRSDAVYELGFVPDPRAAVAVLQALGDPEEGVRRPAAVSLGRLAAAGTISPLVERLEDPAESVRDAAAEALLLFGPAVIPVLASFLSGREPRPPAPSLVRAAAILGTLGDERACDPLAGLFGEHPEGVREAAAAALGRLGLLCGLPALRGGLSDPAPAVRIAAARSLVAIAGEAARQILEDRLRREEDPAVRKAIRALLAGGPAGRHGGEGAGDGRPRR